MNRSLLLIVCDFLLLSILALARFDVPKDAEIPVDGQKVVSNDIVDQKSDGQNYDDVVADLRLDVQVVGRHEAERLQVTRTKKSKGKILTVVLHIFKIYL